MKRFRTIHILTLFFLPSALFSQITIELQDFTTWYTVGQTYYSFADTLTESVDIGQPGVENNWDFSNFTPHFTQEITYVLPSATPYADSFANANVANYISRLIDLGNGSVGSSESWSFFDSNDGSTHGTITLTTFIDSTDTVETKTVTKHFFPFNQYNFPIMFGETWMASDSIEVKTISDGQGFSQVSATKYNTNIDAWGTMKLPSGQTVSALRSREEETTTSYINVGGVFIPFGTSMSASYFFMAKSGESFSVHSVDGNLPNSGTVNGTIGWSNDDISADIERLETIPTEFSLKQNYPNPFNPETNIEYSIIKPSYVNLTIYDILGNKVSELVNESQAAGNYKYNFNGSALSSGTYFVRLNTEDQTQIKKIVLMK